MWILTETIISISQMNADINSVIKIVKEYGSAIIMKNNNIVFVVYDPADFDTDSMPSMTIRDASRNLSKLIYLLYDSGFAVVTKRNKPVLVIYDFNVIKNSNIGLVQIVKKKF